MKLPDNLPIDWEIVKLKKIITKDLQNGYSPNCPKEPNGRWILGLGNLTENGFDPTKAKPAPIGDDKVNDFQLKNGDFLISRSNTLDKVGRTILYRDELKNCSYPDLLMRFRIDEQQVLKGYLEIFLRTSLVRRYIQGCASGTSKTMVKINKQIVKKIPIVLPSPPEQKAIAEILSSWDEVIKKTESLIVEKEKRQRQISKWLIFGHRRLGKSLVGFIKDKFFQYPSDWCLIPIGKIAKEISKRNGNSNEIVLSCSKYDGFVNSLDYFGKKVFSNDTSNYKVIKKWQFGYPSNHIEEGSIGFLEHCDKGIVSPIYIVFEAFGKLVYSPYLFKLLKTDVFKHIFNVRTSSSVDRRGSLRWNEFSKIKILLPSLDEQKEIVELINFGQQEIDLLKQLNEKYKLQKRGLMQTLLTGDWRVKPEILNKYKET